MTGPVARLRRRTFLRGSLAAAGAGLAARAASFSGALAAAGASGAARAATPSGTPRFLVLLRLHGGNDGLGTVIPWQDAAYLDARPTLRVTEGLHVLADRPSLAWHPRLPKLAQHHAAGQVAVVQNVGYAPPDLSHFRSEAIWQSADPTAAEPTGWIGRYLDTLAPAGDDRVRGFDVSYSLDPVFRADHANVFAFPSVAGVSFPTDGSLGAWWDAAAKRAAFDEVSAEPRAAPTADAIARGGLVLSRNVDRFAAVGATPLETAFPEDESLAAALAEVARTIRAARAGDVSVGVLQVGIGGFDTHSSQDAPGGHPDLLGRIDDALDAFHAEMTAQGAAGDVLVVLWSEFGRRVAENGSGGTDHGTAAPVIVVGDAVVPGVHGADPDTAHLDADGNLPFETDFRQVYATLLGRWLGADAEEVLRGTFTPLPFLA